MATEGPLTQPGRLTNEAHNPEGSHQCNAGFSLKAKGSPLLAMAEWEGLRPPTLLDQRGPQYRCNRVGWARPPLTVGRSDTPIPFHGNPPGWGGTRFGFRIQVHRWRSNQLQAQGYALTRRNPDHPKCTGFKNIIAYGSIYVFCFDPERNGCGLRPDQGAGKSWGTGSSGMGIGTMLSCKARRIQRRRVNGKAGIRATLQRTCRLGVEQGRHLHQTVSHAPWGSSLGWSVMIAAVP